MTDVRRCVCKHLEALHAFGVRAGKSVRTYCSASICDCKAFVVDEQLPTACPECGAAWAPEEARRARDSGAR